MSIETMQSWVASEIIEPSKCHSIPIETSLAVSPYILFIAFVYIINTKRARVQTLIVFAYLVEFETLNYCCCFRYWILGKCRWANVSAPACGLFFFSIWTVSSTRKIDNDTRCLNARCIPHTWIMLNYNSLSAVSSTPVAVNFCHRKHFPLQTIILIFCKYLVFIFGLSWCCERLRLPRRHPVRLSAFTFDFYSGN